jgi:hypothetical protein
MILNLISFFCGFLLSSIIDTTLGEFNEWAIVGAALVVASLEIISKFFYTISSEIKNRTSVVYISTKLINLTNSLKIGIIYGLIVDAFKLGS